MASRTSHWRRLNEHVLHCLNTEEPRNPEVDECPEYAPLQEENRIQICEDEESDVCPSTSDGSILFSDVLSYDSLPSNLESEISSCYSSSEEDLTEKGSFLNDLATWSLSNNISHNSLNGLMKLLRKHVDPDLPTDSRTVLSTPRSIPVSSKFGGEYVYLGIESGVLQCPVLKNLTKISILVNIDGLPLFKSSDVELWPILGFIEGSSSPFVIALWSGSGKPSCVDGYLEDFKREYQSLLESGIDTERGTLEFSLKCFTCDAPACQFLKKRTYR